MLMFVCAGTCTICSCSKDVTEENTPGNNTDKDSSSDNNGGDNSSGNNGENLDIHVIVNEDGTTSNGSIFSAIDNQNFYVDYIKYTVTDYYLSVSGYDKTKFNGVAKIISKLTYKGHTFEVLEIAKRAFWGCSGLTSVTIPNSVTRIGVEAFSSRGLTSITIPSSVTIIDRDAFGGCSDRTSVHITDLAAWCKIDFADYDSNPLTRAHHLYLNGQEIKDLVIPNSVTSISKYAFSGCTDLTSVTIPNSVTSISDYAFLGCSGLTSVHITDLAAWCNIKFGSDYGSNPLTYAHHLYLNGQEIKNLVIPNSVTDISDRAFYGCTGLTSVTIPNSVTSISKYAFYGCTGLTSVTIGNSVTSIGDDAFSGCSGLTSVTIGNSVTSIGGSAFWGCTALTSITIPNSVTSIGGSAFNGCYIRKDKFINNSALTSADNWGATLCDDETDEGFLIKDHVVVRCRPWVTSANIPNSVTSIGYGAFNGCTGLTSVTIPNSVTYIDNYAFYGCRGLTSVTIGNSVTIIDSRAFDGCSGLTDVWCYAEKAPKAWDAFDNSSISTATLHVPAASLEEYRAKYPWEDFGQIVAL